MPGARSLARLLGGTPNASRGAMSATTSEITFAAADPAPIARRAIDKDDTPSRIWDAIPFWPVAVLGPALAFGVAGLAGRGPRVLRKNPVLAGLLTGGALVGLAKWQLDRFFTETPDYEVVRAFEGFEIRHYPPRVVAETTVHGVEHDDALNEGFSRLARYIFGDNEGARSAMAAPIELRETSGEAAKGEHIAMTTPVTSHAYDDGHVVTFTMPKHRALELLPVPKDARVRVRRTEGERFAVLTYRGTYGGELARAQQEELLARVKEQGLVTRGTPIFAGYDAPSTLPALRRVEAWVELEP